MDPASSSATQMVEGALVGGRYRLLRQIGAGAMGTVWAARHELLGRDFAIKLAVLPPKTAAEARMRFLREAQIAGKLRHPNIVDVADFGEMTEGRGLYLAMELLSGQSLAELISLRGPLHAAEAVAIAIEVCRGLQAAHAICVVHRDIKPENIFLARGSAGGVVPKLLDFGICRKNAPDDPLATQTGQPFGTPAYMSPEQALGESDIDQATDIWAMGVVLFETITGRHPFVAPSYQALLARIADDPPAALPESVPAVVRAVIGKCLEKQRADRYGDAASLCRALEEALASIDPPPVGALVIESARVISSAARDAGEPTAAATDLPAKPVRWPAVRRRWAVIGILALGTIAATLAAWMMLERAPEGAAAIATPPAEPRGESPHAPAPQQPVTAPERESLAGPATSVANAAASANAAQPTKVRAAAPAHNKPSSRATKVDGPGF